MGPGQAKGTFSQCLDTAYGSHNLSGTVEFRATQLLQELQKMTREGDGIACRIDCV